MDKAHKSPCYDCPMGSGSKNNSICENCILRRFYYETIRENPTPYEQYQMDIRKEKQLGRQS